jgi:hypothetical protein
MYLDDDDALYDNESLMNIVNNITNEDEFLMWRVKFPNRLVPSDKNFGNEPVIRDISGIGYAFHHKHKIDWEPFKRGDYRVAKKLYGKIPKKIYINKPLTKLQRQVEDGFGRRDDKFTIEEIITDFNKIEIVEDKVHPIKSTIEKTEKTINYEKINQIFNSTPVHISTKPKIIGGNSSLRTNTSIVQKLNKKGGRG